MNELLMTDGSEPERIHYESALTLWPALFAELLHFPPPAASKAL